MLSAPALSDVTGAAWTRVAVFADGCRTFRGIEVRRAFSMVESTLVLRYAEVDAMKAEDGSHLKGT